MKYEGKIYGRIGGKYIELHPSPAIDTLPNGFPTHTDDITGKRIRLGDVVTYDFPDNETYFVVVFEQNAFRKKYSKWPASLEKPMLEHGKKAANMRLKIVAQ